MSRTRHNPDAGSASASASAAAPGPGDPESALGGRAAYPPEPEIQRWTDEYFNKTKRIVEQFGDKQVSYAIFMRRPVIFAPRLTMDWIKYVARTRGFEFVVRSPYEEGDWVGAGDPLMYVDGPFSQLVDLETIFLQKLGAACVAAHNAFQMCIDLPKVGFLAMDGRHCAGTEMAEMMAYAASVGSEAAKRKSGAVGFVGNATGATAHFFGTPARGTMPHGLIGYAGTTVRAAEMFHETFPDEPMVALVDYFGKEVTDGLGVCARFPDLAAEGKVSLRLDTHGGRFLEGLDPQASYAVLEKNAPEAIRGYRTETELRYLVGTGVSAAAIWHVRERLDEAGYPNVKIIVSSGFGPEKCRTMASAQAPIDVVGTGSFLPIRWTETYATADVVAYDGQPSIKLGREFLLEK